MLLCRKITSTQAFTPPCMICTVAVFDHMFCTRITRGRIYSNTQDTFGDPAVRPLAIMCPDSHLNRGQPKWKLSGPYPSESGRSDEKSRALTSKGAHRRPARKSAGVAKVHLVSIPPMGDSRGPRFNMRTITW